MNVSFQMDDEKVEELDKIINIKKVTGDIEGDASRSDVLRELVEDYMEGNETSSRSSIKTAAD